jgi:hypothetical protein
MIESVSHNSFTFEVWLLTILPIMSFSSFVHLVISKLSEMDTPSWYLFIFACLFAIWLLLRAIYRAITSEWLLTSFFFLKHFAYPYIFPRIPFVGTATRLKVLIASGYIITNTLLILDAFGAWPGTDIGTRAANMSIVNLIPLLCGPRLSLMTEMLGISLRTSIGTHQWFGRTAIAEILLHTVISRISNQPFKWTGTNISGVAVHLRQLPLGELSLMPE